MVSIMRYDGPVTLENISRWSSELKMDICPLCNQNCSYCYFRKTDLSKWNEVVIDFLNKNFHRIQSTNVRFFGGEPSINIPKLDVDKVRKSKARVIHIVTNMKEYIEDMAKFVHELPNKEFEFQLSLDGPSSVCEGSGDPKAQYENVVKLVTLLCEYKVKNPIKIYFKPTVGKKGIEYYYENGMDCYINYFKKLIDECIKIIKENNMKNIYFLPKVPTLTPAYITTYTKKHGVMFYKIQRELYEKCGTIIYLPKYLEILGVRNISAGCGAGCKSYGLDAYVVSSCTRTLMMHLDHVIEAHANALRTVKGDKIADNYIKMLDMMSEVDNTDLDNEIKFLRMNHVFLGAHAYKDHALIHIVNIIQRMAEVGLAEPIYTDEAHAFRAGYAIMSAYFCPTEFYYMCGSATCYPYTATILLVNGLDRYLYRIAKNIWKKRYRYTGEENDCRFKRKN